MRELASRPWGFFEVFMDEPFYKVRRIVVAPGQRISMQRHHKRAEHWTVVEGEGHAWSYNESGDVVGKGIGLGDAIVVSTGSWHRLGNTSDKSELVLVEVQVGVCEEGDIERQADDYDRS